jgi:prepilin signal peptidase PulO-like enzyme (type II secretory pathway)
VFGVAVALGAALGTTAVWYSLRMAADVNESIRPVGARNTIGVTRTLFLGGGAVVGGGTGWIVSRMSDGSTATLLVVLTLLFLVQGPIDFLTMRLSRPVTAFAFIAAAAIVTIDAHITNSWPNAAAAWLIAAAVVAFFGILHRYTPKSLGFGDVLLVAPLALAVGYVVPQNIALWLLLASALAALHGGARRIRRSAPMIPFGPHLLGAGWLILVMNV